jgi:hypothetical protein
VTNAAGMTTAQHERTQFVRCNTLGHAWFDYDDSSWSPSFGDPLVLRCERCGTERRDVIGSLGQLIQRHYNYPEGYRYGRGERPSRSEFRIMLLQRRIEEARNSRRTKTDTRKAASR